jgi:hypothetical protein
MKKIIKHYPMTDRLIVIRGYIRNSRTDWGTYVIRKNLHRACISSYFVYEVNFMTVLDC